VRGKLKRNRERITVHGLNDSHNEDLKIFFKSAANRNPLVVRAARAKRSSVATPPFR
jgi:hypothetical protein